MYYIYIASNSARTVLYTGVTNSIVRRTFEHSHTLKKSFTNRYKVCVLLYCEEYSNPEEAIAREKQIKNWKREWKLTLIRGTNPMLKNLLDR